MRAPICFVIVFEWGRLGNQLFQYAAIKTVAPNAFILNVGMKPLSLWLHQPSLLSVFPLRRLLVRVFRRLGRDRVLALAGRGRLFTLIQEKSAYDSTSCFQIEQGLFGAIAVFHGFFQDERIVSATPPCDLSINPIHLDQARLWIDACMCADPRHRYFIHVRRGDYTRWPSLDAPAVLSSAWYHSQIRRIMKLDPSAIFFLLTDDASYSREMFGMYPNLFVSAGTPERDLATMALCQGGGVLSASSFAWWGAFYSRQSNNNALFIGPKFWAGWRAGHWLPRSIVTSWIHYVPAF